jgi:hypothetical protein
MHENQELNSNLFNLLEATGESFGTSREKNSEKYSEVQASRGTTSSAPLTNLGDKILQTDLTNISGILLHTKRTKNNPIISKRNSRASSKKTFGKQRNI